MERAVSPLPPRMARYTLASDSVTPNWVRSEMVMSIFSDIKLNNNKVMGKYKVMNTQTMLISVSTVMALISPLVYATAILRGEAIPHRTTRIILLVNTILATSALYAQADKVAIWLAGVSTIQAIFIFFLSLKYGTGGWAKLDLTCLGIAILGMILWRSTSDPRIALYAAIVSDFVGMVPTIVKTYKYPKSEIWQFFTIDTFVGLLNLLAVSKWSWATASYPAYIMLINALVAMLVVRPKVDSK